MEPTYDSQGFLTSVRGREVTLTKWNNRVYVHLNEYSKCWQHGIYDKTKASRLSFECSHASALMKCLQEMESFAVQIESELVSVLLFNVSF